nr:hypothetical protein [uncultured Psychroserpens sp.]
MNFDDIKNKMDNEIMNDQIIPQHIKDLKTTQLPLQKVRRNLKTEILTQVIIFLFFFLFPSIYKMNDIAKGLYFVILFIITLITIVYLLKMYTFLKRTLDIDTSSKEYLLNTIYELNLTLEVYKTAIVSGSLLLPLLAFIAYTGKDSFNNSLLYNFLTFSMSSTSLIIYIISYLIIAILIVYVTNWWTNNLYGKYIITIKKLLDDIND